ncbi:hypothetical protein ACVWXU_007632 [Streptomyces sp. TE33382]
MPWPSQSRTNVSRSRARADPVLGDGGQIGLVLHQDGGGQPLLEYPDQAPVPGGQTTGVAQFAGDRVDQPRCADADAVQGGRPGLARGAFEERDGLLDGGFRAGVAADRHGGLGAGGPQQIGDDHGDAPGAHIEGREVGAVGDDPVQPRVGTAAGGSALADDLDQPGVPQALDQVGDRGAGQAGQRLELCRRQGAVPLEQSQGEPVVDGSGGAR